MNDQADRREAKQAIKTVPALAAGDFAQLAQAFADAGCTVRRPAPGMLQLSPPSVGTRAMRLLLSVGIHGDETAPIEILGRILQDLAQAPGRLAPNLELMLAVGNIEAIAAGKRFVDADLNRMFRDERGDLEKATEARRADEIMVATAQFFNEGRENWHLDLHTAIRPAHYPAFAVVPDAIPAPAKRALLGCLGAGGIEAVILNSTSAGTFSACTAERFGAVSATVELGQIGSFGCNDLERFAAASGMLAAFLTSGLPPSGAPPAVFRVAQQLVKHSSDFRMAFDRTTWNFTKMQPGELIAEDGDVVYRVGSEPEYVVFPNPDVRPGLRAGLMVVDSEI